MALISHFAIAGTSLVIFQVNSVQLTPGLVIVWGKPLITVSADNCSLFSAPSGATTKCIVARPNQSASWHTNKCIIVGLGIVSGIIAAGFGLLGAWLVLPFAGIEITALGGALYIVCRRLNLRHVLYFCGDQVVVEKGCGYPQRKWQLDKLSTSICVERQAHPWDPIKIALFCRHNRSRADYISIGEFLNREDSQQLLDILRQQGLSVRSDSLCGYIDV